MDSEEMYNEITAYMGGNFDDLTDGEKKQLIFNLREYLNQKEAEI